MVSPGCSRRSKKAKLNRNRRYVWSCHQSSFRSQEICRTWISNIILIGHRNHVEIIGTAGEAPEVTTIVESVEDVDSLTFSENQKLFYITQTTLSLDDVKEITDALIKKYPHIETLPSSSICYATTNRQMALREIAGEVDLVLVVGDPQSSNSNRLREAASKEALPPT